MNYFPIMPQDPALVDDVLGYDDFECPCPDCAPIDIGVPEPLPDDHQLPPGVRVTVMKHLDEAKDVTEINGIRATTVERTLVDLSDEWYPIEIAAAMENAWHRGLFDPEQFVETLERVDNDRGTRVGRRALEIWRSSLDTAV